MLADAGEEALKAAQAKDLDKIVDVCGTITDRVFSLPRGLSRQGRREGSLHGAAGRQVSRRNLNG